MKKFLTLKNIIICAAAFVGLVVFFLSFAVQAQLKGTEAGHDMLVKIVNSVWGATEGRTYVDGKFQIAMALDGGVSALPILGFIFVLVGAIGAVLVAILVKKPFAKWIILWFGVLALLGGVFQFFGGQSAYAAYAKSLGTTVEKAKEYLASEGVKANPGALGVILGILSILVGGAFGVAALLPEKK